MTISYKPSASQRSNLLRNAIQELVKTFTKNDSHELHTSELIPYTSPFRVIL